MVISRKVETPKVNISLDGKPVEQVERFVYLHQLITENGKCDEVIRKRIEIARTAYIKMRNVLTNPKLSTSARLRFNKCYTW